LNFLELGRSICYRLQDLTKETDMLSTVEKVLFLKQVELFHQIPGEDLARIARITREVAFAAGEPLIYEGDIGDAAYLIIEGLVKVQVGGREVTSLGRNQFVGEIAILDSEPRSATVTATEPVHALKIEREDFYEIMNERVEIAQGIIKVLTWRLRKQNSKLNGNVETP
jgi:CRP-like cAMP-binding protein